MAHFLGGHGTGGISARALGFVLDGSRQRILAGGVSASTIHGGTESQPNVIGKEIYREEFAGDGLTVAFAVSPGFTVNDLSRINLRANVLTPSGILNYTDGSGMTVSGYGTGTVTVTFDAAPASGTLVEVVIIGEADETGLTLDLIRTGGYDNAVNARMSVADGAHILILDGGGHNVAAGGSYHRIGGSYSVAAGGKANWLGLRDSASIYCYAAGNSNRVDGTGSIAIGQSNVIEGVSAVAFGRDHYINDVDDTSVFGRRGQALAIGEKVFSGGKPSDADPGLYQVREFVLGRDTTDGSTQILTNTGNVSTQEMPIQSAAALRVEVAAIKDDFTKMASFAGDFLFTVDAAGTARVNNSTGDVSIMSVTSIGSPTWTAAARALTGKLAIRVVGAAGENVRWVAYVRLAQCRYA